MSSVKASELLRLTLIVLTCVIGAVSSVAQPAGNTPQQSEPGRALSPSNIDEKSVVSWDTSPVDLSFLNAPESPAGKRGFLKAVKDQLLFEDGTPARFWGTNITARAIFLTPHENVKRQARRLSELGFNLARIHHHDSSWVHPNIFGAAGATSTRTLDPSMLERIDWWIKCLKDEGIYIWLDLHVGRQLQKSDGIDDFDEISKGKPTADLIGYNYVNASIRQAMQQFNEAYLNRENAFTGQRYKDDPAIVAVLLTNENDLTRFHANKLLPRQKVPKHSERYMVEAASFAAAHNLPKDKVWRSWEQGSSKLFLNDLEHRFNIEMIRHLRATGFKALIATTNLWGENPLSSLPALTTGDVVDVHAYGGAGELARNPLQKPNIVDWIAAGHVAGRPLTVTEWNVAPFPVPDRHVAPIYIASSASYQGWDAIMQFAYAGNALTDRGIPSNWQSFNDPSLLATLPAAALLYRRGDVQEAKKVYAFTPTPEQLFNTSISPASSVALRTAANYGKLVIALPQSRELPWLQRSEIPANAQLIRDGNRPLFDPATEESISDTGEIRRNWRAGFYTIDTPRTQAALGQIGGSSFKLADVEIRIETRNAAVAVQSLDEKPINMSGSLLISLGANSVPKAEKQLPFVSETVTGELSIRANRGMKLFRAHEVGKPGRELPVQYEEGRYKIRLDANLGTSMLRLN